MPTHYITLNIDKDRFKLDQRVHVRTGDKATMTIACNLLNGTAEFEPDEGCTASLEILKPDNTWTVTSATISGSIVRGIVPLAAMTAPGECKRAYFRVISGNGAKEWTTEDFYLYVFPNATDEAIESLPYTDQFDALLAASSQELSAMMHEVADIRTGSDGATYQSAGDAVRAQVGSVEAKVEGAGAAAGTNSTVTDYGSDWDEASYGLRMVKSGGSLRLSGTRSGSYRYYNLSGEFEAMATLSEFTAHDIPLVPGRRYELVVRQKSGAADTVASNVAVVDSSNNVVAQVHFLFLSKNRAERSTVFTAGENPYGLVLYMANNTYDSVYEIGIREYRIPDFHDVLDGPFMHGRLSATGEFVSAIYRIANTEWVTCDRSIDLLVDGDYRVAFVTDNGDGTYTDSGWLTRGRIPAGSTFKCVIRKDPEVTRKRVNPRELLESVKVRARGSAIVLGNIEQRVGVLEHRTMDSLALINHIGVNQSTDVVIPCQSIFDVEKTRRLGLKAIELNVLLTSDSKYICTHGVSYKFGDAFESASGSTDYTNVTVSSMTLDQIKSDVRYKSVFPCYRVAPPTLEEMLIECKKQQVIPAVQYRNMNQVAIVDRIMGAGNYVLLVYENNRGAKTIAPCMSYVHFDANATVGQILEKCESSGISYYLGMPAAGWFASNTDDTIAELIQRLHSAGYWVSVDGNYSNEANCRRLESLGVDASVTGWRIPPLREGNVIDIDSLHDASGFSIEGGSASQYGEVSLADGGTVTIAADPELVPMGGATLDVQFTGSLGISLGRRINDTFESDGSRTETFSTVLNLEDTTFEVTASGACDIHRIAFKASRL